MNTENTQEETIKLTVGQQLRHAREQLGLGVKDIADQLCLKLEIIKDIEDDNNPSGLVPTFVRGYIRSYARLVNLPDDELLPLYSNDAQKCKTDLKAPLVRGFPLTKSSRKRDSWVMPITWIIVLFLIGATGLWWWQDYSLDKQKLKSLQLENTIQLQNNAVSSNVIISSTNTVSSAQSEKPVEVSILPEGNANLMIASALLQKKIPALPNQQAILTAESAKQQETMSNKLSMSFSADSWVNATDATGARLVNTLKKKGETLELSGKPPYRVRLGVASAVTVTFKGKVINTKDNKSTMTIITP